MERTRKSYLALQLVYLLTIIAGYFILYKNSRTDTYILTVGIITFILSLMSICIVLTEEEIHRVESKTLMMSFIFGFIIPLGFLAFKNYTLYYYIFFTLITIYYYSVHMYRLIYKEDVELSYKKESTVYYMNLVIVGVIIFITTMIRSEYIIFTVLSYMYSMYITYQKYKESILNKLMNMIGMTLLVILLLFSVQISYHHDSVEFKMNYVLMILSVVTILLLAIFNIQIEVKERRKGIMT